MNVRNDSVRYGAVSQALHWIIVALVIVLLVTGKAGDIDADEAGSSMFMWHGSLGVLVLLLAGARIIWLLVSRAPPLPESMTRVGRILARGMHLALYVLLFALPLSGWLASSAEGASVNFFGIASIPAWQVNAPRQTVQRASVAAEGVEANEAGERQEDVFEEIHEVLGNVLLILVSLHALAALKHEFIDHDGLLRRMLPKTSPTRVR